MPPLASWGGPWPLGPPLNPPLLGFAGEGNICVTFGSHASVVFNAKKSLCVAVSNKITFTFTCTGGIMGWLSQASPELVQSVLELIHRRSIHNILRKLVPLLHHALAQ